MFSYTVSALYVCYIMLSVFWLLLLYTGVAVPVVLQYLREFDAPAMQSCKPLPCGTGS